MYMFYVVLFTNLVSTIPNLHSIRKELLPQGQHRDWRKMREKEIPTFAWSGCWFWENLSFWMASVLQISRDLRYPDHLIIKLLRVSLFIIKRKNLLHFLSLFNYIMLMQLTELSFFLMCDDKEVPEQVDFYSFYSLIEFLAQQHLAVQSHDISLSTIFLCIS